MDNIQSFTVYTDGSADHGHPLRLGGYAAIIIDESGEKRLVVGKEKHTTSQRMELMAAIAALVSLPAKSDVTLHTDSQYLQKGLTDWMPTWMDNGWKTTSGKPVKNADLWMKLMFLNLAHFVSVKWVEAHSGNELNEEADRLAKEAANL